MPLAGERGLVHSLWIRRVSCSQIIALSNVGKVISGTRGWCDVHQEIPDENRVYGLEVSDAEPRRSRDGVTWHECTYGEVPGSVI